MLESRTEAGRVYGARVSCVEPQQQGSRVSTPGTPDMILRVREAAASLHNAMCLAVTSKGKVHDEDEDTRLGR